MKKALICLLALCAGLLSACDGKNKVSGKIVETSIDDKMGVASFIVRTDENKEIGILLTDETFIFSFIDEISAEDFKAGTLPETIVSVNYAAPRRSMTAQDGRKITAYHAAQIEITGYSEPEAVTLPDGTAVDIWHYSNAAVYTLQDGTELLRVQNPTGPAHVYVGGVENFDGLDKTAQNNILEFFLSQGLLYDERAELERAYADYLRSEKNDEFVPYMLSQDISPLASSNTVIYFLTTAWLPLDGSNGYSYRIGTAFDKTTGEYIENRALFSSSPDETIETILDIAEITDTVLREEMKQAFDFKNIILFPDNLEICFPQGTSPSQEYTYIIGLEYDERLLELLHDWAVPTNRQQSDLSLIHI